MLEIGTGSGYQAAVLAALGMEVYTVERIGDLLRQARKRLRQLGMNVRSKHDDGRIGWPEHAPYDAIIVTAAAPALVNALIEQLAVGAHLVAPVGGASSQIPGEADQTRGWWRRRTIAGARGVRAIAVRHPGD